MRAARPAGPAPIEDYALIGDCTTAALVSRAGAIDWLCWPRFDSAGLLRRPARHRRARHLAHRSRPSRARASAAPIATARWCWKPIFTTPDGEVALIDFMPMGEGVSHLVRLVQGRAGRVDMRMKLALRFDYGAAVPWVTRLRDEPGIVAIAGPDMAVLRTAVPLRGEGLTTVAEFTVAAGETVPFVLSHGASHLQPPPALDALAALDRTEAFWREWSGRGTYRGPDRAAVQRSLITLKALTYAATGGIVAAPTTSLPEALGGSRNWDYRYCWLRDATLTLLALMGGGYFEEAQAWRDWLHRSVAGTPRPDPDHVRPGRRAPPVGVGGGLAARLPGRPPGAHRQRRHGQLQLDVYRRGRRRAAPGARGRAGRRAGQLGVADARSSSIWSRSGTSPDEGIWETRGGRAPLHPLQGHGLGRARPRHPSAERFGLDAPLDRWRALRADDARRVSAHAASTPGATASCRASARARWMRACC